MPIVTPAGNYSGSNASLRYLCAIASNENRYVVSLNDTRAFTRSAGAYSQPFNPSRELVQKLILIPTGHRQRYYDEVDRAFRNDLRNEARGDIIREVAKVLEKGGDNDLVVNIEIGALRLGTSRVMKRLDDVFPGGDLQMADVRTWLRGTEGRDYGTFHDVFAPSPRYGWQNAPVRTRVRTLAFLISKPLETHKRGCTHRKKIHADSAQLSEQGHG